MTLIENALRQRFEDELRDLLEEQEMEQLTWTEGDFWTECSTENEELAETLDQTLEYL